MLVQSRKPREAVQGFRHRGKRAMIRPAFGPKPVYDASCQTLVTAPQILVTDWEVLPSTRETNQSSPVDVLGSSRHRTRKLDDGC
jgi:hypothetical protein